MFNHNINIVLLSLILGVSMPVLAAGPNNRAYSQAGATTPSAVVSDDLPLSLDALFDLDTTDGAKAGQDGENIELNSSVDNRLDRKLKANADSGVSMPDIARGMLLGTLPSVNNKESQKNWHGFAQAELAHTYTDPEHWSKLSGRLELGSHGRLANGMRWKASGRMDYNAVYDLDDFYAPAVVDDQRAQFVLRETYLDISSGNYEFRLGRQHIIWGELVGLFFADVVSAKDMREFLLQDFQLMRIPQWAARAEYFNNDYHAEVIWVPFPSFDKIGKPGTATQQGSDFFAYPASPGLPNVLGDQKPGNRLENTNYGLRLSRLTNGWDMSGFLYSSLDGSPTYYLVGSPVPGVYNYLGRHDRIQQVGATLAKDLVDFVLKVETIYTAGRRYNVTVNDAARYPDGVVKQDTLDWVVGLDFNPGPDTRLNTQFFQRIYFSHDTNIIPDRLENGFSLLLNHRFTPKIDAEALLVRSLNRTDWMLRPRVNWNLERNWKLSAGLDIFNGPSTGIFGQFDDKDRIYTELRYDY